MELGGAFKRIRSARGRHPTQASRDPADAYTELAGLFVGGGVIDDDLIGVLLDPSQERDDALLALAAGRRAEAAGHLDEAIDQFERAIEAGHAAEAPEVVAHAAHDCARTLFIRNEPPDDYDRCRLMLDQAHASARARRMSALCARIEELEAGVREDHG